MYFLHKMGIFQPAMFVYRRVPGGFCSGKPDCYYKDCRIRIPGVIPRYTTIEANAMQLVGLVSNLFFSGEPKFSSQNMRSRHYPEPPIIIEVKNGCISNNTYLSNTTIFHFHDYGRKSRSLHTFFFSRANWSIRPVQPYEGIMGGESVRFTSSDFSWGQGLFPGECMLRKSGESLRGYSWISSGWNNLGSICLVTKLKMSSHLKMLRRCHPTPPK